MPFASGIMEGPKTLTFELQIAVTSEAIDRNGHVNNVVYVQWMQDLAVAHWTHLGGEAINAAHNATWVARSHQIEYLRPSYLGDQILATTWIESVGKVRSTRKYAFYRLEDKAIIARGETDWVFVRLPEGRPTAIPESVHQFLAQP